MIFHQPKCDSPIGIEMQVYYGDYLSSQARLRGAIRLSVIVADDSYLTTLNDCFRLIVGGRSLSEQKTYHVEWFTIHSRTFPPQRVFITRFSRLSLSHIRSADSRRISNPSPIILRPCCAGIVTASSTVHPLFKREARVQLSIPQRCAHSA